MADALAGNPTRVTDVVDTVAAGIVADTSIGTAAAGFTDSASRAVVALNGKLISVRLLLTRSGAAITQTNTDMSNTALFTLDAAYRPDVTEYCHFTTSHMVGSLQVGTNGVVTITAGTYTIDTSDSVGASFTYLKE